MTHWNHGLKWKLHSTPPLVHALSNNLTPFSSLRILIAWSFLLIPWATLLYISSSSPTQLAFLILLISAAWITFAHFDFPSITYMHFFSKIVFGIDCAVHLRIFPCLPVTLLNSYFNLIPHFFYSHTNTSSTSQRPKQMHNTKVYHPSLFPLTFWTHFLHHHQLSSTSVEPLITAKPSPPPCINSSTSWIRRSWCVV